jgi:hypothetical protein
VQKYLKDSNMSTSHQKNHTDILWKNQISFLINEFGQMEELMTLVVFFKEKSGYFMIETA